MLIIKSAKVFACFTLLVITGCAKHIVVTDPTELPVRMHAVSEYPAGKAVNLIGEKTIKESKLVQAGAYGTFYFNHQQWAETAASLAEAALAKKGVIVSRAALKSLEIFVVNAEYDSWSSLTTTVNVKLRVKAGNGYSAEYSSVGNRYAHEMTPFAGASWGSLLKIKSNHALTKAVEAMLNDKAIISYLKE